MTAPRAVTPDTVSPPVGGYSHGVSVPAGCRTLFVSGQIPERPDGSVPEGFAAQCRAVWANIAAVLAADGMTVADLVKVNTFLTSADQVDENGAIRREVLGGHRPALTVMIARTLESQWLLEIDAIAVSGR